MRLELRREDRRGVGSIDLRCWREVDESVIGCGTADLCCRTRDCVPILIFKLSAEVSSQERETVGG
jgi:hypothetical protein